MFKIIQKGSGPKLTPSQLDQLKTRYEVIISGNGDCLFGAAFRGILEIYDKQGDRGFPVNPSDFFEDKFVVIGELLQLKDLGSNSIFQIAVRNFRRYIYDCLIEFLKTKNYKAIFEVFSVATIYEFLDFVYYGKESTISKASEHFFNLFNSHHMYKGSVDNILEEEFIDISIKHFTKMKIEDWGIDVSVYPEYYGGQLELTSISYLFNVIFYLVNDRIATEISSEPTGNPAVSIDRAIPILYQRIHYNAIKLDFIESEYFADIKKTHTTINKGRNQAISDSTIVILTDIGKKGFIQSVKPVSSWSDTTPFFARQSDRPISDSLRGKSTKSTTTYPMKITQPANPIKLSGIQEEKKCTEIITNFNLILEKLKKIKKLGDIYNKTKVEKGKTIYDNFIEKISLYTFYQGNATLKKNRFTILKRSKSPLTSFIKSLIEKIDSSSPSFKFDMVTDFVDISELAFNILNDCENFKTSGLAQDKLKELVVIRYQLLNCEILFIVNEI